VNNEVMVRYVKISLDWSGLNLNPIQIKNSLNPLIKQGLSRSRPVTTAAQDGSREQ
jgi:hypothetical protein